MTFDGLGLTPEAQVQMRRIRQWIMLRGAPILMLGFALWSIMVSPVFWFACSVTALFWLAALIGMDRGRLELSAVWRACSAMMGHVIRFVVERWRLARAKWIATHDEDPDFWLGAPRDETHAGYRADYRRLVGLPVRGRLDLLELAETLDGLANYGDDPLVRPRQLAPATLGAFSASKGALSLLHSWSTRLLLVSWAALAVSLVWIQKQGADLRLAHNELNEVADQRDRVIAANAGLSAAARRSQEMEREAAQLREQDEAERARLEARRRQYARQTTNVDEHGVGGIDLDQRLHDFTIRPFAGNLDGGAAGDGSSGVQTGRPDTSAVSAAEPAGGEAATGGPLADGD